MKKSNGFTLIELMIVVAIVGILAMYAAPSFNIMVQNNQQATQTNTLIAAFNFARSEAIKRGVNVVLCRSATGAACANANGWEQGWLTYVDTDGDNTLDGGEPILHIYTALSGRVTLTPNGNYTDRVVYQPNGFTTQVGTFVLCGDRDTDGDINDGDDFTNGRAIIISRTGRARSDTAPNSTFATCTG